MTDRVFHLSWPGEPPFGPAAEPPLAGVTWDDDRSTVGVSRPLSSDEVRNLRNVRAADGDWQVLVDRLVLQQQHGPLEGSGAYPSTLWGRLLVDLEGNDHDAWHSFLEDYREPVRRSLLRMADRGVLRRPAVEVTDDFFGWFYSRQVHQRVRRIDGDGRVYRFRGFLKKSLWFFLQETTREDGALRMAASDPDRELAETADLEATLDREFCREAVVAELEVIRRDQYSLWRSLLDDFAGRPLREVAQRLEAEGAPATSVARAHRDRHSGRSALRSRLVRYRLTSANLSEDEAVQEYVDLIPDLAQAVTEYFETWEGKV